MTQNTNPIFTLYPQIDSVQISTANTNKDGATGTYGTLVTGAPEGTRIHRLIVKAPATTTAGIVRFFLVPANGTPRLYREISVPANTVSATAPGWEWINDLYGEDALILPSGCVLKVSTEKAEPFNIFSESATFS